MEKATELLEKPKGYETIIEHKPYSKSSSGESLVSLSRTGLISISEGAYKEWVSPNPRVKLYFLKGTKGEAVGIQPIKDGGLAIIKNRNSKSQYVAGKGFIKKFGININSTIKCRNPFDEKSKMLIVPLNSSSEKDVIENEAVEKSKSSSSLSSFELANVKGIILSIPEASSRMFSKPDLFDPVARALGLRRLHKGSKRKKKLQNFIIRAMDALVKEGKFAVIDSRPYKGKTMKLYRKSVTPSEVGTSKISQ